VCVAGAAERLGGADEVVVGQLLVAELDDVDAAPKCRVEELRRIAAVRPRFEDEVEA